MLVIVLTRYHLLHHQQYTISQSLKGQQAYPMYHCLCIPEEQYCKFLRLQRMRLEQQIYLS
jgi:hypothetical protein